MFLRFDYIARSFALDFKVESFSFEEYKHFAEDGKGFYRIVFSVSNRNQPISFFVSETSYHELNFVNILASKKFVNFKLEPIKEDENHMLKDVDGGVLPMSAYSKYICTDVAYLANLNP